MLTALAIIVGFLVLATAVGVTTMGGAFGFQYLEGRWPEDGEDWAWSVGLGLCILFVVGLIGLASWGTGCSLTGVC